MMKKMNIMYAVGLGLITLFGVYYYQDILFDRTGSRPSSADTVATVEERFRIKGMHSDECPSDIQRAVNRLPGVVSSQVSDRTNEITVVYTKGQQSIQKTIDAIQSLGYKSWVLNQSGSLEVLDYSIEF